MLLPECCDGVVFGLPFRHGRAPVAENGLRLFRCALAGGNGKDVANALGQRVGLGGCVGGESEAESPDVVGLVVVRVRSAMLLTKTDREDRASGEGNRLFKSEYGFARLVAEPGTDIDTPCGIGVVVVGVFDRAGDAAATALVLEDRFEQRFRRTDVRGGVRDLDLRGLLGRVRRRGFDLEFG